MTKKSPLSFGVAGGVDACHATPVPLAVQDADSLGVGVYIFGIQIEPFLAAQARAQEEHDEDM